MNTLPTIEVRPEGEAGWPIVVSGPIWTDLHGSPALDGEMDSGFYSLVYQPDGLVLVREDCDTCGGTGTVQDVRSGGEMLVTIRCHCLGVPLLVWYRECDQCDGGRRVVAIQTTIEPARREDFGPCRNCVEVDGRRLVKVRRNP